MTIIINYFPLPTFIILILGVIYFLNRKRWIALTILILVISCSLLNGILLTAPIFDGSGFVNNLPQLLMWTWPDLLVLIVLVADMRRTCGLCTSRG
jgi:hypothetical protein